MQVQATAPRITSAASLPKGVAIPDAEVTNLAQRPDSSLPMLAPIGGSTIKLLTDEGEVLPDMLAAARGAQKSIDLTMFSLADSGAGKQMIDSLVERSTKGVQVRVTLDQVGSAVFPVGAGKQMVDRMEAAGVQVAVNGRVKGGKLNAVDHRKLLVVDDKLAYTGGMNLSKKFGKWHDVMVRVDGPAAARLGAHFVDRWTDLSGAATKAAPAMTGGRTLASTAPAGIAQAGDGVSLLANFPGRDMHASEHLLDNLAKAEKRAWILTPTLSDPAVVQALKEAAARGVDARVAVSGPEGWIGTRALGVIGSTFYRELVSSGVKVYEQPGMSHAKVSLVDDVASVGSLNMTRRAMMWDHELMLASDEKSFVGQIEQLFTTDFAKSNLVTQERADSRGAQVGEAIRKGIGLKW
ncbi:MAG: cardiolipin synthase [Thermoleophilia bacterium]|nr:cardiolipin synthase [Thermoleophilia bacterium]